MRIESVIVDYLVLALSQRNVLQSALNQKRKVSHADLLSRLRTFAESEIEYQRFICVRKIKSFPFIHGRPRHMFFSSASS